MRPLSLSKKKLIPLLLLSLGPGPVKWAAGESLALETEHQAPPRRETWSLHAQATAVPQGHSGLDVPYSGSNSLDSASEFHTSFTSTLFLGRALWQGAELYLNPEAGAGSGLSSTHGIAEFPNGEIYRVDDPNPKLYLSRVFLRQTLGLGAGTEHREADKNQLATELDVRRVTLTAGKLSLNDIFDDNAYAHDPRTQFLNWVFMDFGSWDYAADTRGYTWALIAEYNDRDWALRLGGALVAASANGLQFDTDIGEAHALNAELEYRYQVGGHGGKARLLSYVNRAHMGNYQSAIAAVSGTTAVPDITQSRAYRTKYGIGLNIEQELTRNLGLFSRIGWSDGDNETWMFTEIDRIASLGLSLRGSYWGRAQDTVGLAYAISGLSSTHAQYLSAGGVGFMIGDGHLNYGPESVAEIYYEYQPASWASVTADYQYVDNPAFNRDRDGVSIFAGRVHLEL